MDADELGRVAVGPAVAARTPLVLGGGDPLAQEGGCGQEVWPALAEALEEAEPWEAMIIYREQVEPTIERKRKADYREATAMLAKVRDLMDRTGHGDEFPAYLEKVRERHKRKRNLTKLLQAPGSRSAVALQSRMARSEALRPGDIAWARPEIAVGREQAGRRPAMVVAGAGVLEIVDTLAVVVPITTVDRRWPNHVEVIGGDLGRRSWAMSEQVRTISRRLVVVAPGGPTR
jgi:mRNA interferase MazF